MFHALSIPLFLPSLIAQDDIANGRFGNERWAVRLCPSTYGPQQDRSVDICVYNLMEYFAEFSVLFLGGLEIHWSITSDFHSIEGN
jgi:hypothetical protein